MLERVEHLRVEYAGKSLQSKGKSFAKVGKVAWEMLMIFSESEKE